MPLAAMIQDFADYDPRVVHVIRTYQAYALVAAGARKRKGCERDPSGEMTANHQHCTHRRTHSSTESESQ
jgi:hypothetical protein